MLGGDVGKRRKICRRRRHAVAVREGEKKKMRAMKFGGLAEQRVNDGDGEKEKDGERERDCEGIR